MCIFAILPVDFDEIFEFARGSALAVLYRVARPLRLHVPGMLYHVMSRGNDRQSIFTDCAEYNRYLHLLAVTTERFRVRCLAYCLMANHVHLLLQPFDVPISRLMQQLNSAYCHWFNRHNNRVGHVLQGRFKSLLVESDVYFLRVLRYIVRNPVSAHHTNDPAGWPWSSYRATAGLTAAPRYLDVERVWRAFDANNPAAGQERFIAFAAINIDDDVSHRALLIGSENFTRCFGALLQRHQTNIDFVYSERFAARPSLRELLSGAEPDVAREKAVRRCFCEHGYTLREIAAHVGRSISTVWAWIQRAA